MNDDPPPSGSHARSSRPAWGRLADLERTVRLRLGNRTSLILIALMIGTAAGFGAVFFRWLIHHVHLLAWGPSDTPLAGFARSPWPLRIGIPALGGLLVGLIVKYVAPEAKGHGVPEVMLAVARRGGVIRPVVAVAKSFASAICIGTGGSVGREGPIVQIGSAIGSTVGQVLHLSPRRIRVCVGCGAAAGIAATFNAPIAGAFFAAEIVLGEFRTVAFGPLVIASVMATVVSQFFLGNVPAFRIPQYSIVSPAEMIPYAILGVAAGVVAILYVRCLHWFDVTFDRLRAVPDFLRPVIGGVGIGLIGLWLPQIMGVGYDTITSTLRMEHGFGLLVAILAAKLVATSLTLGSGGSGGVFAPSLLMGAALGWIVGHLSALVAPFPMASHGAYAVVGMGAMVAAATHAPITAILIIFEMTGDYRVILGLMMSVIIATRVAQRLDRESIYTIKLARRGIDLQAGREVNVLRQLRVRDVMTPEVETLSPSTRLNELFERMTSSAHFEFFTVDDKGDLEGVLSVDDLRRLLPERGELSPILIAGDIATAPVLHVRENDTLDVAMLQFGKRQFGELPVVSRNGMRPIGTLRRDDVINAYNREIVKLDLEGSLSARIAAAASLRTWETVGGYVLAQLEAPPHLCGRTLESLRLRQERGVQVLLARKTSANDQDLFSLAGRDTVLHPGDRIVVFGLRENVERLGRETG